MPRAAALPKLMRCHERRSVSGKLHIREEHGRLGGMNLKEAASQLGVHYQTAYKWVRTGALTAVRLGGRYEVSDAAIEQFAARRAALRLDGMAFEEVPSAEPTTRDDVIEALEAMATDPFVSRRSVATFVARRGAELVGDLCVVACLDDAGATDFVTFDHPSPAHVAVLSAAVDVVGPPTTSAMAFAPEHLHGPWALRLSHVPQDRLQDQTRPELRQHLYRHPVLSLLSVSVESGGVRHGVISFTRDAPDRPYTEADEAFALELSERVAVLCATAKDVAEAVAVRRRLAAAMARDLVVDPDAPMSPEALRARLDQLDTDLSVAVLDPERRVVAVNRAVARRADLPAEELTGRMFESTTHAEDAAADRASFERLVSGELDFVELRVRRMSRHGEESVWMSHRAAIRAADATLRSIVTVGRELRIPASDIPSVSPTVHQFEDLIGSEPVLAPAEH